MIKRALDCGAHAVMVPMCETKVILGRIVVVHASFVDRSSHRNKQKPLYGLANTHLPAGQKDAEALERCLPLLLLVRQVESTY